MSSFPRDPAERPAPYERFREAYERGTPPWDTKIAPPELVEVVEGTRAPEAGRALDLGCGTGTNSLYLARHGWEVTGIDFIANAIGLAREKLRHVGSLAGKVRFLVGNVTDLDALGLEPGYTLLFDLGCLHSIDTLARARYAQGVTRLAAPGALFLVYGFMPNQLVDNNLTRAEVQALFEPAFTLERAVESLDRPGIPASWYWLRRMRRSSGCIDLSSTQRKKKRVNRWRSREHRATLLMLFVLRQGLPASLLTGAGHIPPNRPLAEH